MSVINIEVQKALADVRSLVLELNKLKTSIQGISGVSAKAFNSLTVSVDKLEKELKQTNTAMKKLTTSTRQNNAATKTVTKSTSKYGGAIRGLGIAGALILLKQYTTQLFRQIKTFNSLDFAIKNVLKTTFEYTQAYVFLGQLTEDYGATLENTANRWLKFRAAAEQSGLSLKETQDIFRSMTKTASVLGLKTDELRGIYLALEQMLSKGKVTTEELRRQLGERLPGAMGIMARSLGVTIPELDKMLKKGEVLSAEVLPNFAREMEKAFGIENIDRVENLQASVGRLEGTWDSFMSSIARSDSQFNRTIIGIIDDLQKLLKWLNIVVADPQITIELKMVDEQKKAEKEFDKIARERLKREKGVITDIEELELALLETKRTIAKEDTEILQKQIDADEALLKNATKNLGEVKEGFRVLQYFNPKVYGKFRQDTKLLEGAIDSLVTKLSVAKSKLAVRKLATGISVEGSVDGEGGAVRLAKREASLENAVLVERLKFKIAWNKDLIESDRTTFAEKEALLINNLQFEKELIMLQLATKTDAIETWAANQRNTNKNSNLDDVQKGVRSNEIFKKERDTKLKLEEDYLNKFFKLEEEFEDKSSALSETNHSNTLKLIQSEFDKKTTAAKREFELSNKTNKDEVILDQKLSDIRIESINAIIDAEIAYRFVLLENMQLSTEAIELLKAEIDKLEASRPSGFLSPEDYAISFDQILQYAQEFANAVNGIVDGIFNTRIENINAEIDAESRKYDKLIELARGDEEQQKTLQRNKEARIRKLEKERLKEEQKKAKADKKFAAFNVLINTARAIASVSPNPVLIALAAAVGAAQLAAVIAQPIPQFKDGGKMTYDGLAQINDGGSQEYVERGGNILTSSRKDAIVNLEKGDVIHKDYNDMITKSLLFNGIFGGGNADGNALDLLGGIEDSIEKGFKRAKINNNISVLSSTNSYRDKMSRWN